MDYSLPLRGQVHWGQTKTLVSQTFPVKSRIAHALKSICPRLERGLSG